MLSDVRKKLADMSKGRSSRTLDAFSTSAAGAVLEFESQTATRFSGGASLLELTTWLEADPGIPFLLNGVLKKSGLMDLDLAKQRRSAMPELTSRLLSQLFVMANDETLLLQRKSRRQALVAARTDV